MEHAGLTHWIEAYERAWRTAGTDDLGDLFASDARYSPAPFAAPVDGLDAIAEFWEAEREGPDEEFTFTWAPVALEGRVAVARVDVRYAGPPARDYKDLWVMQFDVDGRCTSFEEWPFHPGQARTAS